MQPGSIPLDIRPRVLISNVLDPVLNLAAEEAVFEKIGEGDVVLLLYRNDRCVVIGKHQNPWNECPVAAEKVAGLPVFRRISGGGTVYHDPGNLNYSFLVDRSLHDKQAELDLVLRGLDLVGISGKMNERGDLLVGERKVSGNALAIKKQRVLHHGTLLVNADLDNLRSTTRTGSAVFHTHAVASNPAPVANLTQVRPQLTMDLVVQALIRAFRATWGANAPIGDALSGPSRERIVELSSRLCAWEWTFGRTPRFTVEWDRTNVTVEDGVVVGVESDDPARQSDLSATFRGTHFDIEAVEARLAHFAAAEKV